jgi:hypothetical protein
MTQFQFIVLILAIIAVAPVITCLLLSLREKVPKKTWNGEFSLILGDGTLLPVRNLNNSGDKSFDLPKSSKLLGIVLHGVPIGHIPCVEFDSNKASSFSMDKNWARDENVRMTLNVPWTDESFPRTLFFYTDATVSNPALKHVEKYEFNPSKHPGVWCYSLYLSFAR